MQSLLSTPFSTQKRQPGCWLWRGALLALLLWVVVDLFMPSQHNIRKFDPKAVANMEISMWQSYYERKPVLLFWQLAAGLRQQFHAPFWRSFKLGFQASKAAFDFKKGRSPADYQQALPGLITYYESIQNLSSERFDVQKVATLELEWWIVHRQREQYSYIDLADALVQTAAAQYNQPTAPFRTYGRLRAGAMQLRDESSRKPGGTTEADWQRIEHELAGAWSSLHRAVQK